MSKFVVSGTKKLKGSVTISGAKNAALKIIAGTILGNSSSKISNVPNILDIDKIKQIITKNGADVQTTNDIVTVNPGRIKDTKLDPDLTRKLRGSIVLAGPMLSKFGTVSFAQPGGCLIGARAIDDHLDVFKQFGVKIKTKGDLFYLSGKPKAGSITLCKMSVTATENAIMTAVLSKGTTYINVAAAEPEINDLIKFLNKMGAIIKVNGHQIIIRGVSQLKGVNHRVLPDRIEAGTYLISAIATNSQITIKDVIPDHLSIVLKTLEKSGAKFIIEKDNSRFNLKTLKSSDLKTVSIDTRTYPGFPTDLQSVYTVYSTRLAGLTRIFETLFEGRFGYIKELKKMGAKIDIESPHIIHIKGPQTLRGTKINCLDIRGGAALVVAAIIARGETTISNVELIDRGYENIDKKFANLGAKIKRI